MEHGINGRYGTLTEITWWHSQELKKFLDTPREERVWGLKPDDTYITINEYDMGWRLHTYLKQVGYHLDSVCHEEMPMLRPHAEWWWYVDPFDPTKQSVEFDQYKDDWQLSTTMLSLGRAEGGMVIPVAFGLGVPLREEIFYGSVEHGVYRNGEAMRPPVPNTNLILNVNQREHCDRLRKEYGHPGGYLAGPAAYLVLKGEASGGAIPTDRPYEANCVLAIVRAIGTANPSLKARVTDEDGREYHSGTKAKRAIWTLPHCGRRHEDVVEEVRSTLP